MSIILDSISLREIINGNMRGLDTNCHRYVIPNMTSVLKKCDFRFNEEDITQILKMTDSSEYCGVLKYILQHQNEYMLTEYHITVALLNTHYDLLVSIIFILDNKCVRISEYHIYLTLMRSRDNDIELLLLTLYDKKYKLTHDHITYICKYIDVSTHIVSLIFKQGYTISRAGILGWLDEKSMSTHREFLTILLYNKVEIDDYLVYRQS